MQRFLTLVFTVIALNLAALPALAAENSEIRGIRSHLNGGKPDLAIGAATQMLRSRQLAPNDRQALLAIIAEAETTLADYRLFTDIKPAIAAIDSLLREFPDAPQAAEMRWKRAWLLWQGKQWSQAIMAAREITTIDQQPEYLMRAWMLMARIHIASENYAYGRSDLLQYGILAPSNSEAQATGHAWMAMIDFAEKRYDIAYKTLDKTYNRWPELIAGDAQLFATYIRLRYRLKADNTLTFKLSDQFIRNYATKDVAPPVRLIHADILATNPKAREQAIEEYAILSQSYAETTIGKQAFIRKIMLQYQDAHDRDSLLPAMISLQKVAGANQLTIIEDEAMLGLARFWTRIDDVTKSSDSTTSPALAAYARAATSEKPEIAAAARKEGGAWLTISLEAAIKQGQSLKIVSMWRKYPQLQPAPATSQELRLNVAHALRTLMLFSPAEEMLNELYRSNLANVRGQRIMLELGNLWLDRGDKDGVKKIMHWLNLHEFTIYRPEMLVIVARMQLAQHQADAARQTLRSIRPTDVSPTSRPNYWRATAETLDALKQYHAAASAWHSYRSSTDSDKERGLLHQALSLYNGKEFAEALKLYLQVAEPKQDSSWQYHTAICEIRSGQLKNGLDRLQRLADSEQQDTWTNLARLALADHQANTLLGTQP